MFNLSDLKQDIMFRLTVTACGFFVLYLIKLIVRRIRMERAAFLMIRHIRKNLKSDYNYMDHASDNYHLSRSKVILCSPNGCSSAQECVLVNYLYHNRMQESDMDEKHYFHIHLFYSDIHTKNNLYKKWQDIRKNTKIDQPRDMNGLSPIVLGLKLCVVMFFKWRDTYYFVHKNNSFVIDYLVDCEDANSIFKSVNQVPATCLENIVLSKIAEAGLKVCSFYQNTGFTDIGLDDDELYLRLFYFVGIEKPADQSIAIAKAKKIPQFIKDTTGLSKAFKSSLIKLNLLCEGKVWE